MIIRSTYQFIEYQSLLVCFKVRTGFVCKSNGVLIFFFFRILRNLRKCNYFKFYVFDLFFVVIVYFAWIVCIHSYVNVFHYIFGELWIQCRVCLWNSTCTYKLVSLSYFNYLLGSNLYDINMCDKYIFLDEVMIQNKMKFDIPDILNFYSLEKIVMIMTHAS